MKTSSCSIPSIHIFFTGKRVHLYTDQFTVEGFSMKNKTTLRSRFGIVQWFAFNERKLVLQTAERFKDLGVIHLRTGVSWIEYEREGGKAWYDFMVRTLHDAGIHLMVMLCYTPPEKSETGHYTGAPRSPEDFGRFVAEIAARYKGQIDEIQIWNEPNNIHYWDQEHDPDRSKFATMLRLGAAEAKQYGMGTVLGGLIHATGSAPHGLQWQPDAGFLAAMQRFDALQHIDAVAFHAFPGMWVSGDPKNPEHPEWSWGEPKAQWQGWNKKIAPYSRLAGGKPVIVTETGYAAYDWHDNTPGDYEVQSRWITEAARSPVRVYWYSLFDIPLGRVTIGGDNGTDPRNPYFGLIREDGTEKPAYAVLKSLLT